ncbi:GNAT family N-acetyltransferase [Chloroflexota bacterium]
MKLFASNMIASGKIILRDKKLADAQDDYTWQSDPELAQLDASQPLKMTFSRYLSDYASILSYSPSLRHSFAIETSDGKHIGNCAYFNIDEKQGSAEVGLMIGDRSYWDQGYGSDTITALVDRIFRETDLKRTYLKTLVSNARAQRCFQKCGFTPYGHQVRDGFSFVFMELQRKQWHESINP